MADAGEELVKVCVALPEGSAFKTESFWARPLGNDLYELRNCPFFAKDLHFYDVVRAVSDRRGGKPRIVEVVRRSGHKTLRVVFSGGLSEADRARMLQELHRWKGFHEHAWGGFYAIDVEPGGDYGAVCDRLHEWEQDGLLEYETGATGEE